MADIIVDSEFRRKQKDGSYKIYHPVTKAKNVKAKDGTDLESYLAESPTKTRADITYYVNSATGSDSNNGLTNGTAFKTIQYAINKLPQVVNHNVNINIAQGTYNEDVLVYGFVGKGNIGIAGGNSVSSLYKVSSLTIFGCVIPVTIIGVEATKTGGHAFVISNSLYSTIDKCKSSSIDTVYAGVALYGALATVSNSQFDNHGIGIRSSSSSTVYSNNNTGSGNTYGLVASSGGAVCKDGKQPSGTTAESTSSGGAIR